MRHPFVYATALSSLSLALSACGAAVAPPAARDDAGAADVTPATDDRPGAARPDLGASGAVDAATPEADVVSEPVDAGRACTLEGSWAGWWSYREAGHGETRTRMGIRFTGDVRGEGINPSGAVSRGSRGRDGSVGFTVGESGGSVGFGFHGQLDNACDTINGSYATHSFGGSFALHRVRCAAPTQELALDGRGISGDLTNSPLAMLAECERTAPSLFEAYTLRVARRAHVALRLVGEGETPAGLAVSIRSGCDAPSLSCAAPGSVIREQLEPGSYRVVVSARVTRTAPFTLRAETIAEGPESRCEGAPYFDEASVARVDTRRSLGADSLCGAMPDSVFARIRVAEGRGVVVTARSATGVAVRTFAREGCGEACSNYGVTQRDGSATLTLPAGGAREVVIGVSAPERAGEVTLSAAPAPRG